MTGVMLFAALMLLYRINDYPPGLDPDSAAHGLDALKLVRHGVWPFYSFNDSNADPIHVYTAALATKILGARVIAVRLPAAFYALLGLAMTYTCLAELGRGSFAGGTRRRTALLSVVIMASSQIFAFINRMGLRFSTEVVFQMATLWALSRALRNPGRAAWLIAGALAGLTQYTYLSARVLPLLFILVFVSKAPRAWWNDRRIWKGIAIYLAAATATLLPQIVWYARYPHTFFARAAQTGLTSNPLYALLGFWGTLLDKLYKYWEALGSYWPGQYNQIYEPFLAPLFYSGFLLGLLVGAINIRKRFVWILLCGAIVMLLPDLIAGDRDWPHELRVIGAYPFVAGIAGLGLGGALNWLSRWNAARQITGVALAFAVMISAGAQANEFFSMDANLGRMYWGGNSWLRRVDAGVGKMIDGDTRRYLLPLENYADAPVKYLTGNRAAQVRSALDADGSLLPILRGDDPVRLFLPRGDADELWNGDATQWALFEGNTVYILPPLPADALTRYFPAQDDSTVIFGKGMDEQVRLGHWADILPNQIPLEARYTPDYPAHICFRVGMCLDGVSYNSRLLAPGGQLRVDLFWSSSGRIKEDYILFLHLLDRSGNAIAGGNEYPLDHGYRTYEWKAGETIISTHTITLPGDLAPGMYGFEVGFFPPYDVSRIETVDDNGNVISDRGLLMRLKAPRPAVQLPDQYSPAGIKFADEVELVGYRIDALPSGGGPLRLTLWWRGLHAASQDWTSFFHLTSQKNNAELFGQLDHEITGGEYPPRIWDANELVEEQIEIAAPALEPGTYAVWMGLYSPLNFERAPITASPYRVQDNRAMLLEFDAGR